MCECFVMLCKCVGAGGSRDRLQPDGLRTERILKFKSDALNGFRDQSPVGRVTDELCKYSVVLTGADPVSAATEDVYLRLERGCG